MQAKVKELIDKIAKEHNLPPYVVEEIVQFQYRFLRDKVKSGENKVVMLPGWGKYIPSMTKLAYIEKHNARKASDTGDAVQRT
jgi:nucleoid DNA-binding protein